MGICTCGIETARADTLCVEPDCPWRSLPLDMLYRERQAQDNDKDEGED